MKAIASSKCPKTTTLQIPYLGEDVTQITHIHIVFMD